jgi:hypothetical protein
MMTGYINFWQRWLVTAVLCGLLGTAFSVCANEPYQIEMIVFDRPQVPAELNGAQKDIILSYPKHWQRLYDPNSLAGFQTQAQGAVSSSPSANTHEPNIQPYQFLPRSKHLLSSAQQALTRSGHYRILFHEAWQQPLINLHESPALLFHGGQFFNPYFELQGYLSLGYQGKQLQFNTHLWLSKLTSDASLGALEIALPVEPKAIHWRGSEPVEDAPQGSPPSYIQHLLPMKQSRKLKPQELHYLDHPKLGVLIQVTSLTPLEVPEDTGPVTPSLMNNTGGP